MRGRNYSLRSKLHAEATILGVLSANRKCALSSALFRRVLLKGMSSEKHFSLPDRQKYFPASSPPATLPTLLL
jgi:hypothetical protein